MSERHLPAHWWGRGSRPLAVPLTRRSCRPPVCGKRGLTSGVAVIPPADNRVMGMTMIQLADRLRTEADAYKFLEELCWPDGIAVCPHCDNHGATYIEPTNGKSRATRTGTQSQRRVWRCLNKNCRKQFSVIT